MFLFLFFFFTGDHVVVARDGERDAQRVGAEAAVALHVRQRVLVVGLAGEVDEGVAAALAVRPAHHLGQLHRIVARRETLQHDCFVFWFIFYLFRERGSISEGTVWRLQHQNTARRPACLSLVEEIGIAAWRSGSDTWFGPYFIIAGTL